MIVHPYQALPVRNLRAATIAAAWAWVLLTLILFWAVPLADVADVQRLVSAPEPDAARDILRSWGPSVGRSFSFLLGFDFLYDVVHNNAAALLAVWGAARQQTRLAHSVAAVTAWVLWLDTGLNVFENLAFLHVLRSGSTDLLSAATAIFSFRSATLTLAILVGIALHASAWRAHRVALRRIPESSALEGK